MRPIICSAALFALAWPAAGQDRAEERRDLPALDEIEIQGGLDLRVSQGEPQSVVISGRADYVPDVETSVEDGRLIIDMEGRRRWNNADIHVTITLPNLSLLEVNGAIDGDLTGLDVADLKIIVNGAGDIDADGRCNTLSVELNGAADIDAEELRCAEVAVQINGAGNATVFAAERIDAEVNGVGNIDVMGNPGQVSTSKSLLSNITIHKTR